MGPEQKNPDEISAKEATGWMPNPARRIDRVSIEQIFKQGLTILKRDITILMDLGYKRKLDPQDSKTLIDYLKLIQELKALEELNELEKKQKEKK